VAQLAEEAVVGWGEPALRALFAAQRGQLAQKVLLLLVEPRRRRDVGVDDEVTTTAAAKMGDTQPAQGHGVAGLRAGLDLQLVDPVERVQLEGGAEGSGRHRQLNSAVQVVSAPLERDVGKARDHDVEVSGATAA